ncbi:outer membrane beta-barrel family protein [Flaviramulus aquimarinus]|uniref:Outer membrane beta-barrel family protein n=2 Tax=Flaviramulus aquimarinus TaxID=1170456 RepID=A0ABP9EWM3_9FLAO
MTNNTGTISGEILDATSKQPLPYVNIIVIDTFGKTINGGITLDDGSFTIDKITEGKVVVSVQYIGYRTINKNINISKGNHKVNLGVIFLEEEIESLDLVTIVAEVSTIRQKADKKIIIVGKDLTTAGTSASDILNNIPSVSVDQQTGNIRLRGNENVRVMIDGKLSNIPIPQLLKQIPSTSIKQIELITNPSAKFNPEGMSGIINIKLIKNTNIGFNGNINVGVTKGVFAKFNSSIDMNYRNGKFNFHSSYSNNIGKYNNYGETKRLDDNSLQNFNFGNDSKSHLYKVGVDFYLNKKHTISFFTNQNIFDGKGFGNTILTFDNLQQSQALENITENSSAQYNLAYKLKFEDKDELLDIVIDYNDFEHNEIANFDFLNFSFPPNYVDQVNTKRDQATINIDYIKPLNENTEIEVGLEARLFNSDIHYKSTGQTFSSEGDIISTPNTDFKYNRGIYSAYFTYGKTLEKWNYQFGIRAEQVNVTADAIRVFDNSNSQLIPFANSYFQVYPSAFIIFKPSDENSYQLSFARRIDRPGLQQVNPIREWSSPRISSFGNSQLQPQFTNSIEINYTKQLKKGSITAGMFYRIIKDNINRVVFVDRTDITAGNTILSYDNFDNTTAFGAEISTNYKLIKWWSINASFDIYSQLQRGKTEIIDNPDTANATIDNIIKLDITVDNVIWNLKALNNFKVSKKLNLSFFGLYSGEEKGIQSTRKPIFTINTGVRYKFLEKNRATFSFNYNDVLNTMKYEYDGFTPFPSVSDLNWESNSWSIALIYKFGGG